MKEKPTATKKATMRNFYHQYYNTFSIIYYNTFYIYAASFTWSTYNSYPVATSTSISKSNKQNFGEGRQEGPSRHRDHWLVAMWKENIQGIESGKSRSIYPKTKAEIDTLETLKNIKQIREKLRNLKDSYKVAKENNRKSGSAPEFPQIIIRQSCSKTFWSETNWI